MIEPFRSEFNARFTSEQYASLLRQLDERVRTHVEFRVAETPCFFDASTLDHLVEVGS